MKITENISIKKHTTFGVDAQAHYWVEYTSVEELQSLICQGFLNGKSFMNVGGGSNLLFCSDYDGVLLHSCIVEYEEVARTEAFVVMRVGAGVVWDDFVSYCVSNKMYGAENLSLIPGSVGASPVQNIGAYGVEAKDLIEAVECVKTDTGECVLLTNADCNFGYRDSVFKHAMKGKLIVTHVHYKLSLVPTFKLEYGTIRAELGAEEPTLENVRKTVVRIRKSKLPDPEVTGNAGSFFKNPVISDSVFSSLKTEYPTIPHYEVPGGKKIPAAWLIEQSGWKGKALGRAAVHNIQPLVLINLGGAIGADIVALSDAVRSAVRKKFDIEIEPEVIFVGQ